jgi:predicted rRNA methylase YqxC with S4 and FtsJ domains
VDQVPEGGRHEGLEHPHGHRDYLASSRVKLNDSKKFVVSIQAGFLCVFRRRTDEPSALIHFDGSIQVTLQVLFISNGYTKVVRLKLHLYSL